MRRRYIIQILLVAAVIGLGGYSLLGGWRKAELSVVTEAEPYTLVGYYFEGEYDDPQLGRNFRAMREFMDAGTLAGQFAVVYWKHPEDLEGKLEQMMGVLYPTSQVPDNLPQDLTTRELPGTQWARATLRNHVFIRTQPRHIREKLQEYAKVEGLTLGEISIERFDSDWFLEVDIPVVQP